MRLLKAIYKVISDTLKSIILFFAKIVRILNQPYPRRKTDQNFSRQLEFIITDGRPDTYLCKQHYDTFRKTLELTVKHYYYPYDNDKKVIFSNIRNFSERFHSLEDELDFSETLVETYPDLVIDLVQQSTKYFLTTNLKKIEFSTNDTPIVTASVYH